MELIQNLLELEGEASSAHKAVHLVFSTRDHTEIWDGLKDHGACLRLDLTNRMSGMKAYAWQRVCGMKVLSSQALKEGVVDEVCDAAQGLWL